MPRFVRFLVSIALALGLSVGSAAGQESSDSLIEPLTIDVLISIGQDRVVELDGDGVVAVDATVDPREAEFEVLGASIAGGPVGRFDVDGSGSFDSSVDLFTSPDGVVVPADPVARGAVVPFGSDGTVILPSNDAFFSSWLILVTLEVSDPIDAIDGESEIAVCTHRTDLMAVEQIPGFNIPCGDFNTTTALVSGVDAPLRAVFTQTSASSGTRGLFDSPHIVTTSTLDDRHFVSFAVENPAQAFTAIASNGRPGELPSFWFETTPLDVEVTEITDADMVATAEAIRLKREADRFADSLAETDLTETDEGVDGEDPVEGGADDAGVSDVDPEADADASGGEAVEAAGVEGDAEGEASGGPIEIAVDINEPDGDAGDGFSWAPVLVGVAVLGGVTFFYFMWVRQKDEDPEPVHRDYELFDASDSRDPDASLAYLREVAGRARADGAGTVDGRGVLVQPSHFFDDDTDPTGRLVPDRLRALVVETIGAADRSDGDGTDELIAGALGHVGGSVFANMSLSRPREDHPDDSRLWIDETTGKVYRRIVFVDGAELGDPISMTDDPRVL